MRRIPLHEFVSEKGQAQAAVVLGLSQGGLSKAIRLGRRIFVNCHEGGAFSAEEVRPFPSQSHQKRAA